jgi:hypothetical protein
LKIEPQEQLQNVTLANSVVPLSTKVILINTARDMINLPLEVSTVTSIPVYDIESPSAIDQPHPLEFHQDLM